MNTQDVMSIVVKKENLAELFPNLALIALLIPTSTADCERGFSTLKRIKTPLRNRLSNAITVPLMFISIECPSLVNYDFNAVLVPHGLLSETDEFMFLSNYFYIFI